MKLIGFNLRKILTEKTKLKEPFNLNTNIEFTDVSEEKVDLLKEMDALKISFKFSITYTEKEKKDAKFAEITFDGDLILALSKDESKNILKSWKKKEVPQGLQISLFNLIIRKCTPKAVFLAEELTLPLPIQIPKIKPAAKKE